MTEQIGVAVHTRPSAAAERYPAADRPASPAIDTSELSLRYGHTASLRSNHVSHNFQKKFDFLSKILKLLLVADSRHSNKTDLDEQHYSYL